MSPIQNVPSPWVRSPSERTPKPRRAISHSCIWAGYLPPEGVEKLYTRIRLGLITQRERDAWLYHWYRVVLMVMKTKMKTTPLCGWYYNNGWLFRTRTKVDPRHVSLFEYLIDRVMDLSYRPSVNGPGPPKTSAGIYFQLRRNFWTWKAMWELTEAGVGGIKPFEHRSIKLARSLVDYHYWRNKAAWYYEVPQPTVQQSYDLLAGNVPEMLPEGDELATGRRSKDKTEVLRLWGWFNEILTPRNQPIKES